METELVNAVLAMDDAAVVEPKKFVIFIDTQVDFMLPKAKLFVKGADGIIGALLSFAYSLKASTCAGVLFTFDTHEASTYYGMPESKQFDIHCELGAPGHANVIPFDVIDDSVSAAALYKGVFDMWEEDEVFVEDEHSDWERELFFQNLKASGVDTVIVVGVAADFCVKQAIRGLLDRGFKVEVPRSLTAGIFRDIDTVVAEDFAGEAVTITD